jgi:O-antigen biosynthesis protein
MGLFFKIKSKILQPLKGIVSDKNYRRKFFNKYAILVNDLQFLVENDSLNQSKQEFIYNNIIEIGEDLNGEIKAVNLVIPYLEPSGIFGGLSSALSFSRHFINLGYRLNIIYLSPQCDKIKEEAFLKAIKDYYSGAIDLSKLTLIDRLNTSKLPFSKDDLFIATFWTTALAIKNTLTQNHFNQAKFIYMIQDFEPGFYAWSDDFALADYTYTLNFIPVFNAQSLFEYVAQKHPNLTQYHNHVIKPVVRFPKDDFVVSRQNDNKSNILIYGRPSKDRNLFNLIIIGLKRWIEKNNIQPKHVSINSIGEKHADIDLVNSMVVKSLGKMSYDQYIDLLGKTDIGVSLMLSPHPSYPPLEMALHGVRVITNRFENKQLKDIDNLSAIEPYPENLADELEVIYQKVKSTKKVIPTIDFLNKMGLPMEKVFENLVKKLG